MIRVLKDREYGLFVTRAGLAGSAPWIDGDLATVCGEMLKLQRQADSLGIVTIELRWENPAKPKAVAA